MQLSRLPAALLLNLELALASAGCGDKPCLNTTHATDETSEASGDVTVGPCLFAPPTDYGPATSTSTSTNSTASTASTDSTSMSSATSTGTGSSGGTETTHGSASTTGPETTTQPKLDISGGGESTTESPETSTGPCLVPPLEDDGGADAPAPARTTPEGAPVDRDAVIDRVLAADRLPADVVARLRARRGDGRARASASE